MFYSISVRGKGICMLRDISLLPVLLEGCLEDSAAVRFPGARVGGGGRENRESTEGAQ